MKVVSALVILALAAPALSNAKTKKTETAREPAQAVATKLKCSFSPKGGEKATLEVPVDFSLTAKGGKDGKKIAGYDVTLVATGSDGGESGHIALSIAKGEVALVRTMWQVNSWVRAAGTNSGLHLLNAPATGLPIGAEVQYWCESL